jgi:hypothetical protein
LGSGAWSRYTASPPTGPKLWAIRAYIVLFYLTIPANLINAIEEAKMKRERLLEKGREQFHDSEDGAVSADTMEKLRLTTEYLEEARRAMLTFRRNELSMEITVQTSLQIVMLLLSPAYTVLPTHSGLQAVFKTEGPSWLGGSLAQTWLILSILLSLRTAAMTHTKIKVEKKLDFLPLAAKVILAIRSLLVYSTRICCISAYFGPECQKIFGTLIHFVLTVH